MSNIIQEISALEVLDSKGHPTVEASIHLESGICGKAMVPSGASTGKREATELRDNDNKRYLGKGVQKAVTNIIEIIQPHIIGMPVTNQVMLDDILIDLDGTEDKSKLGANAILAVSMAIAHTAAHSLSMPLFRYLGNPFSCVLPVPFMNIINGGAHANNSLDFQEFMIVPVAFSSFSDSLRQGVEIFHHLKRMLEDVGISTAVGDEGGFAINVNSNEEALQWIVKAIDSARYCPGKDTFIAMDVASSEFYRDGFYYLGIDQKKYTATDMVELYKKYTSEYPIISIEDGMAEDDWAGWELLTKELGKKIQLVGDDLFVTNKKILSEGITKGIANSILVKVNQIGTLTEAIETIQVAHHANYTCMVSHRSGETEDTTIADLSVAYNTGQIKTGSLSRTDRIAKYNQLLRIEQSLGKQAKYAGNQITNKYLAQ